MNVHANPAQGLNTNPMQKAGFQHRGWPVWLRGEGTSDPWVAPRGFLMGFLTRVLGLQLANTSETKKTEVTYALFL